MTQLGLALLAVYALCIAALVTVILLPGAVTGPGPQAAIDAPEQGVDGR